MKEQEVEVDWSFGSPHLPVMVFSCDFTLHQATPLAYSHLTRVLIGVEVDGRVIDGRLRGSGGRGRRRSCHSRRGGGARGGRGRRVGEGGAARGGFRGGARRGQRAVGGATEREGWLRRLLGRSSWSECRRCGGDGGLGCGGRRGRTDGSNGASGPAERPRGLIVSAAARGETGGGCRRLADGHRLYDLQWFLLQEVMKHMQHMLTSQHTHAGVTPPHYSLNAH